MSVKAAAAPFRSERHNGSPDARSGSEASRKHPCAFPCESSSNTASASASAPGNRRRRPPRSLPPPVRGTAGRSCPREIGRASCRERGCQYVLTPVVAEQLKKKNKKEK